MPNSPLVSVTWLAGNFDSENLIVLDASPSSNVSGLVPHLPELQISGAEHFDMENVFVDPKNELPNMFPDQKRFEAEVRRLGINKESIIVVYDNLGIYTSPRAWWMFKSMGHKQVAVLDGGLKAWEEAGYPCEKRNSRQHSPGNFEASFNQEAVCDSSYILSNLNSEETLVIDARSAGRFSGNQPEPRPNMQSGHIPNAINVPYKEVLSDGKMKRPDELKELFELPDQRHKKLIFSCGSGVTACILLLAAELINSNTKSLFDGSWSEWGNGDKFPVVSNS